MRVKKRVFFQELLIYLLVFLLPVQLGRHFFFNFSRIGGLVSDYLTPVIYLTDIIILVLIFLDLKEIFGRQKKRGQRQKQEGRGLIFLFFTYLLISSFVIAGNKWAAIYKFIKIGELFWLFKIIIDRQPKIHLLLTAYSLSVIYTSLLAIRQFIEQQSIGGAWWYLGERSFHASTAGIALGTLGGRLFLRAYATFAHPNLLGGFLSIGLPMVFLYLWRNFALSKIKRIILTAGLILGTITLVLTFSRASWLVFGSGMALVIITKVPEAGEFITARKKWLFPIFIFLIIISVVLPLNLDKIRQVKRGSLFERSKLIKYSLVVISQNPVWGTGLNNAIIKQYQLMPKKYGLFILQPVHNTYLLILTELGLTGFLFLLIFLKRCFEHLNRNNVSLYIPWLMLLALGFFDHYLVTLQQGQLLVIIFTSLVFNREKG
ncbi:hypothetical protein A2153_04275 [Candidatus Gottesmanbacteria bacterium RBG_16_38_7b]|uniref:O-antigen ligase-related domain-containing protein n=1 Tax=Candidatus Gottesmanbacteria bacterium RBG_16_38_7b TaxID=1798372 RepID=A0A1F5YLG2_9BACT|nr:MAG: hypothetical protein A2153_04275 [Candidatus Gottesmanbacteria bacterium RBG_16_38_7b]